MTPLQLACATNTNDAVKVELCQRALLAEGASALVKPHPVLKALEHVFGPKLILPKLIDWGAERLASRRAFVSTVLFGMRRSSGSPLLSTLQNTPFVRCRMLIGECLGFNDVAMIKLAQALLALRQLQDAQQSGSASSQPGPGLFSSSSAGSQSGSASSQPGPGL